MKRKFNKYERISTYGLGLMLITFLLIKIRDPLLYGGFVIRILKKLLKSLRGQVCIRPMCGRARDGRKSNHQRGVVLHDLR